MEIPKEPKGMKDPVLIAGNWEERVAPPPTAGHTKVDIKTLDPVADKEQIRGLKGVPFRAADKKKKYRQYNTGVNVKISKRFFHINTSGSKDFTSGKIKTDHVTIGGDLLRHRFIFKICSGTRVPLVN